MKIKFHFPPTEINGTILLCGIDFDDDTRESKYLRQDLFKAIKTGLECISPGDFPWKSFEIWGWIEEKFVCVISCD